MKTLCMTEPLSQKMGTWAQITFLSVHDRGPFSDDGDLGTDCIPLCAWQRRCLRRWGPGHTLHSSLGLGTCKEQMKRRRHSFPRYKHKGWIQSAAADPECQPVAYRSHPRKPASLPQVRFVGRSDPSAAAAPYNNPCDPSTPNQLDLNYWQVSSVLFPLTV